MSQDLTLPDSAPVNTSDAKYSGVSAKAMDLLGQGIQASIVAQTLGVSESYISQLLSEDAFRIGVVEKRYSALQAHTARDAKYDAMEDTLLDRLKETLPMVFNPLQLTKILQTINAAKRRGQQESGSITQQNMVVNLTMPTVVMERFAVIKDTNNQILEAGEQKLITIQSGSLLEKAQQLRGKHDEVPIQNGAAAPATQISTSPRRIGSSGAGAIDSCKEE